MSNRRLSILFYFGQFIDKKVLFWSTFFFSGMVALPEAGI